MRDMLQSGALDWLGPCDPFDATVDAALFVARKRPPAPGHRFRFVQARPLKRPDGTRTSPEDNLGRLIESGGIDWEDAVTATPSGDVFHSTAAELRVHEVPLALYQGAHKRPFFEPRPGTLRLYERFNGTVRNLVDTWWERIENSRVFGENREAIRAYHRTLRPGDVTLVGLIAEGGQGMRTANNARFLAYLDGTPPAREIRVRSEVWSAAWLKDEGIRRVFTASLREAGGDPARPTADRAAWEAAVHALRECFTPARLGFGRTDLFRLAPPDLIAGEADFAYAFQRRKAELLARWQASPDLRPFWDEPVEMDGTTRTHTGLRAATDITDERFCALCQALQCWIARENADRKSTRRIPRDALGLRPSETYADPADAPRIATIYNGLQGRARFVPFRKGDPAGNRWLDNEPLYCEWTRASVDWLSTDASARWQGHTFFLQPGITWSLHANHVAAKCRYQEPCVFDASSSRLTPVVPCLSAQAFVAIANADVFSFLLKKFRTPYLDNLICEVAIV